MKRNLSQKGKHIPLSTTHQLEDVIVLPHDLVGDRTAAPPSFRQRDQCYLLASFEVDTYKNYTINDGDTKAHPPVKDRKCNVTYSVYLTPQL